MENKFKLGQILCERCSLKKTAIQRYYYVVIQEETDDKYLVIQAINTTSLYASGTSISPTHPEEDLVATELKASYLLYQEITVLDTDNKKFIIFDAIGFEGKDRLVKFTPTNNGDLIGNIYYELRNKTKLTSTGFLYCDFYRKEKFIK
ncbi:hypothetical protein [Flavobacterium sp.]|uniref:hypothetical protein n=1 Tax=Flavobacterium sp. TaxID=239 RepID=UPI002487C420|nr:hypothetical protein [Flavobacterium sp.]MDI1317909.1 hypothetical protein [Flavobacterium sp.]